MVDSGLRAYLRESRRVVNHHMEGLGFTISRVLIRQIHPRPGSRSARAYTPGVTPGWCWTCASAPDVVGGGDDDATTAATTTRRRRRRRVERNVRAQW
jgi:hypothetical protein